LPISMTIIIIPFLRRRHSTFINVYLLPTSLTSSSYRPHAAATALWNSAVAFLFAASASLFAFASAAFAIESVNSLSSSSARLASKVIKPY
jgi:hypothetical protein